MAAKIALVLFVFSVVAIYWRCHHTESRSDWGKLLVSVGCTFLIMLFIIAETTKDRNVNATYSQEEESFQINYKFPVSLWRKGRFQVKKEHVFKIEPTKLSKLLVGDGLVGYNYRRVDNGELFPAHFVTEFIEKERKQTFLDSLKVAEKNN